MKIVSIIILLNTKISNLYTINGIFNNNQY